MAHAVKWKPPNSSIASQLIYTKGFVPFKNIQEAQHRTKVLYRRGIRLLPWLIDTYQIDEFDRKHLMRIMRKNIEQHKDVKDLDTLSVLIFKGEHSFQEAAMLWKTRSHVLDYFTEIQQDNRNYLERFFANEPYKNEEENDAAMEEMWQEAYAEARKMQETQKQGKAYVPPYILTEHYFGRNPALDKHKKRPFH
eukprot:Phypoly_transcript_20096.p1 GENE.Phypoly_transcript_20096~~Phypoly_transcript_20096.p1  ORF type:complete len:208 (+),score=40.00 Phypoly_transcript_20096:44-625(+)